MFSNVLRLLNLQSISLREPQVDALRNIVEKRKDVLVVLSTGYGKSLIFQLLLLLLVVSPFNALMRDQSIKLDSMKVPSVRLLCIRNGRTKSVQILNHLWAPRSEAYFIGKLREILDSFQTGKRSKQL